MGKKRKKGGGERRDRSSKGRRMNVMFWNVALEGLIKKDKEFLI